MLSKFIFLITALSLYAGNLTIYVEKIPSDSGDVTISLFNSKRDFPKMGRAYKSVKVPASKDGVRYTFRGISSGIYAVSVKYETEMIAPQRFFWQKGSKTVKLIYQGFSNNPGYNGNAPYFVQSEFVHRFNDTLDVFMVEK